jgi:predicted nucleic-acid-binding protein
MIAVDTNVLVRLLTDDDRGQVAQARALFATEEVWVPKSVLLETSWVLKSVYRFRSTDIHEGLRKLLGLSNVTVEDRNAVVTALSFADQGLEFANALHFASSPAGARFFSFDESLVKRVQKAGVSEVVFLSTSR